MALEVLNRRPVAPSGCAPLLLVHGAWHGAWCWAVHFMDYFAAQGFEVHALSLRGHGASSGRSALRWARVADYVADVAAVARQLSSPPVLVGHSMGGLVVQNYLAQHAAPAAVLMASVPPAGIGPTAVRLARHHPWVFAQANATFSLYPLVATPARARELFFSDALPETQVQAYWARLQDESVLAFLDMLAFDLPRPAQVKAPMLVLGGSEDALFRPDEVEATAQAYNTRAVLFQGMAHDLMLEPQWKTVAAHMAAWVKSSFRYNPPV